MTRDEYTPNSAEHIDAQARYALAMHFHAKGRVGKFGLWLVGPSVLATDYLQVLWPLGVALVATIAAYLFVTRSCARMVERTTGVPAEAQAVLLRRHNGEPWIARRLDRLDTSYMIRR